MPHLRTLLFLLRLRSRPAFVEAGSGPALAGGGRLAAGATCDLGCRPSATIVCNEGCLWITHDGDTRDVVLDAGQSHRVDRPTRILIMALQAASWTAHDQASSLLRE